ncbi:PAS domain S-box protein [Mucilaginibacter sp.]|uniref:PAS domain-containing sensor histidine kinase n=1 Tax=Mucilaginibacter sp. TaxID=1882438 RepID=UPI00260F081E|nr:PAS domain S-box protein [Mucilaginibacter sp.]MDB4923145.1 hypothetical protein [Mucilaginibacter sp.]
MPTQSELYQKVTSLASLGVWERNLLTDELYWNATVREIYEVTDDFNTTLEKSIAFYQDAVAIKRLIYNVIKTGKQETGEFLIITARGKLKWVKLRIDAGFNGDKCELLYGTLEDITEQIILMRKLAEREEQFHHAFEYAPIGMALVSPSGKWIRVNKTLCQLVGYGEQEFLKRTFQDITHPEDLDIDLQQMYQLLEDKITAYNMDKRYFHKDGSIIWVSLNVTLVRDQLRKPLYFVSQIKDITERRNHLEMLQAEIDERKSMELERIKTLEIIRGQNSRLLNFAHIVSHNLRSHTANIQVLSDMIAQETDPIEKEDLTGMLGVSAASLQETLVHLNEIVDVHTNYRQSLKHLNLYREIHKAADALSASLRLAAASLFIEVDPGIEIEYDQAYLESILLNLLTNGIKYRNAEKPLEISIKASQSQDQVILVIQDNGLGIDMNLHGDKLFGMYKTFHGNKDARGIGLFLVKNQVEAMGGQINAYSKPGEGMRFTIEFKKASQNPGE